MGEMEGWKGGGVSATKRRGPARWRGAAGALKGGANGVLCAALHPCKQCTMHVLRYGTRTEN